MDNDKRERILRAALALAKTDGLESLSVRSVAAAAGVGATTLRNYFPSQALLHQAVAERFIEFVLDDRRIRDATLAPAGRLFECLEQFLPSADDVTAALSAWLEFYRLSYGPDRSESVRELLLTGRRTSARAVERWLIALREEGHAIRGTVEERATALLVLVDGLHLTMLTDPHRLDLAGARGLLREYVETSVFADA